MLSDLSMRVQWRCDPKARFRLCPRRARRGEGGSRACDARADLGDIEIDDLMDHVYDAKPLGDDLLQGSGPIEECLGCREERGAGPQARPRRPRGSAAYRRYPRSRGCRRHRWRLGASAPRRLQARYRGTIPRATAPRRSAHARRRFGPIARRRKKRGC